MFYINLAVSILLMVVGFLVPPMGVIDGSVLTAVGLLLMFVVIEKIPALVKAGKSIRLSKGDFTAEVESQEPREPPAQA